ncbi:MAG: metallophosphoesterase [Candidatus Helarchaeota archaeon]
MGIISLKIGLCSDIDLGHHFKHMTSKKKVEYELKQLEHFDKLIQICIENRIDILIIAGNLFGNPNPKNNIHEKVVKGLRELVKRGVKVYILPGMHDTPLHYIKDSLVHYIIESSLNNIKILQKPSKKEWVKRVISDPIFEGQINNVPIKLFTVPNVFSKLESLKLELRTDDEHINCFVLSDLMIFKNRAEEVGLKFLEKLNRTKIDILFIGGIIPEAIDIDKYNYQIEVCPQVHPNSFDFSKSASGLKIIEINERKQIEKSEVIKISNLDLRQKILDINQISIDNINEYIENIIKTESDINRILQLKINGILEKDDYHQIKVYNFIERGKRHNFYFEFVDMIEFEDAAPEIKGLSLIQELQNLVNSRIEEIKERSLESNLDPSKEISKQKKSFEIIKKDWDF